MFFPPAATSQSKSPNSSISHHSTASSNTHYSSTAQATPMTATVSAAARFKLIFFVPPSALAACKAAIFAAGAGHYPGSGNYTECCWTAFGTGQFRPGRAANPNIGKVGDLEEVQEAKVETLCLGEDVVRRAVEALKRLVFRLSCLIASI